MIAQFDNKVLSSTFLWLDNRVLQKGSGFSTTSAQFYPTDNVFNGYYSYSSPFKQFVSDFSISGATVMTGVYLNNTFITTGTSGLSHINYEEGSVLFNTQLPGSSVVSGSFSIKDFNVAITNDSEEKILFETKHYLRPKIGEVVTGLFSNEITYPVIYLKDNGGQNNPFAFGGLDETVINIRAIILCDSQFYLDAVSSILRDSTRTYIPLIADSEQPFNQFGGFQAANYNYLTLTNNKIANGSGVFIKNATVSRFDAAFRRDVQILNPETYMGIIDIQTCAERYPRLS